MNLSPTLTGPNIELRPTTAADWPALYAVAADPQLWAIHPAHDRWQEPVFRAYFDDALAQPGALTVRERATGRVIGASRFRPAPAYAGIEIGWTFIARDHWGGTTNAEMKRLMLDHLFGFAPRAVFIVGEGNLRSRRALEKIGARATGEVETRRMAGADVVHLIYAIDRA
ncbi:GNAT family N-acetyltransferase [Sphingomonas sp. S1-29]|uniref:GNAT family N-acetyltransferase n=1 Tax=Sphingomonas sp. S1-29 TaxID=2991074 RepID=UPI0022400BC3|nr:GNAT family N-acetyltransferase [Sphingomonas sp. S1-29]UZK68540.1 GNAT family N-acetyltransferase [Sphingomonas sp. S1-29]